MTYQECDIQKYIKYWNEDFSKVLLWYYTWWGDKSGPINNLILSAKHNSFDDIRPRLRLSVLPETQIRFTTPQICPDEYFFSASMYYISAIPQIICKVISPNAARNFLNSSGWPAISLGLGGFMSPEQILYESGLLPYPNEVNRYISLLNIVHPFQKKEILEYMSGHSNNLDQSKYELFCEEVKGSEDCILEELDKCQTYFRSICYDIKNGNNQSWSLMYLDDNCSLYSDL